MVYARYPAMRNWEKRCKLEDEINDIKRKIDDFHLDAKTMNDEEYRTIRDALYAKLDAVRKYQFSLECPATKSEWLKNVISGYKDGTYRLSQKQRLYFAKSAEEHPGDHYHRSYCRVGNRLISFHFEYMTVETIVFPA